MSLIVSRRIKFVAALILPFVLFGNGIMAVQIDPSPPSGLDSSFIKWAMTQGGLTMVLVMVLWSYRRDLQRVSEAKEQTISVLMDMVGQNMKINTSLTAVVESLAVEVRRLEDSHRKH